MTDPIREHNGGSDAYLVAHLREKLAEDPRTNEIEVNVVVVGRKAFLTGTVASQERREAITLVARESLPDHEIHNQTSVAELRPPEEAENLT